MEKTVRASVSAFAMAITAILLLVNCTGNPKSEGSNSNLPTSEELIQRGEYLVTIMGCNDCHSPKRMGPKGPEIIPELMLSGYPAERPLGKIDPNVIKEGWALFNADLTAAAGPWGVAFAGNLTSDQTGIGNWSEENFKRAIKEGKFKGLEGSRMLLPPMPWTNFVNISDADAHAIFTYLKSVPPVHNVVPAPIAPADIR